MARKKISTTVYLDAWQVDALKHITGTTGVPTAKIIRGAIDVFLEERMDPQQMALYKKAAAREEIGISMGELKERIAILEAKLESHTTLVREHPQLPDGDDEGEGGGDEHDDDA